MPELRKDPVTGNWVVVGYTSVTTRPLDICPFCPGNEHLTPETIRAELNPHGEWRTRCFSALKSVFRIEAAENRRAEGLYDKMDNLGAHEIIVDHREHAKLLGAFSVDDAVTLLRAYAHRIGDLKRDHRFKCIQLFRNQGSLTGSHIGHPHSHVLATPILTKRIELELGNGKEHFQRKDRCLYCDMVRHEMRVNRRLVAVNGGFAAFCPFASRAPFETWIVPRNHHEAFEEIDEQSLFDLALILLDVIRRVERNTPAHTLILHTAPGIRTWGSHQKDDVPVREYFHWHIEILPKDARSLKYKAEDEFYVVPGTPEESAEILRADG